jgi:hypothetical protein
LLSVPSRLSNLFSSPKIHHIIPSASTHLTSLFATTKHTPRPLSALEESEGGREHRGDKRQLTADGKQEIAEKD